MCSSSVDRDITTNMPSGSWAARMICEPRAASQSRKRENHKGSRFGCCTDTRGVLLDDGVLGPLQQWLIPLQSGAASPVNLSG
jgi:hypothetical protein